MSDARNHRRWVPRYSLRTLLIAMPVIGMFLGWVSYELNWIGQRRAVVARPDVVSAAGSYFLEPPPIAPWHLRLFGETSYRSVALVIVDDERAGVDEMYVDINDPRLMDRERSQIETFARLFPEARAYAWFRKTP